MSAQEITERILNDLNVEEHLKPVVRLRLKNLCDTAIEEFLNEFEKENKTGKTLHAHSSSV